MKVLIIFIFLPSIVFCDAGNNRDLDTSNSEEEEIGDNVKVIFT